VTEQSPPLSPAGIGGLDFAKGGGLLPAIVQDFESAQVLMLGFMSREALQETFERGRVVFFSRSRNRLWEKGESSAHSLEVVEIRTDCDCDSLLIMARPHGPTCHLGASSCFGTAPPAHRGPGFLAELEEVIARRVDAHVQQSYTARLLAQGVIRIAQKVGEEGLEVALAAATGSDQQVRGEVADLLYHVLVLLRARGMSMESVEQELRARHATRA
jgi:phosphoribosyl-ATP pyrophosphohydrolase/phosphoribosyl-AMP cyclohydrolase